MTYVVSFACVHCGESRAAQVSGEQGVFTPCGCKDAVVAWEKEHRAAYERRKRLRRPQRRKRR